MAGDAGSSQRRATTVCSRETRGTCFAYNRQVGGSNVYPRFLPNCPIASTIEALAHRLISSCAAFTLPTLSVTRSEWRPLSYSNISFPGSKPRHHRTYIAVAQFANPASSTAQRHSFVRVFVVDIHQVSERHTYAWCIQAKYGHQCRHCEFSGMGPRRGGNAAAV